MEFTKGEWGINDYDNNILEISSGNKSIADCWGKHLDISKEEQLANAHLISAAPDMYEALKELINTYVMNKDSNGIFPHPKEFIACITPEGRPEYWDKAIKALAKAEGK